MFFKFKSNSGKFFSPERQLTMKDADRGNHVPPNLQTNLEHKKKNPLQNISNRVRRPRLTAEERLQVSADHCLVFFVEEKGKKRFQAN